MQKLIFASLAFGSLILAVPEAHAIGCLSGGAAGALAGHMAGHGVLGAAGGCIAGHAWHKHQTRMNNQSYYQTQSSYNQGRREVDPDYSSPWR